MEISEKMLGVTAVVEDNRIMGIITDGDIRRMLYRSPEISDLRARDIMSREPKTIPVEAMAVDALEILERFKITQILAVKDQQYYGVVHLHNLIREGII